MKKNIFTKLKGVFFALFLSCLAGFCAFASNPEKASALDMPADFIIAGAEVDFSVSSMSGEPEVLTSVKLPEKYIEDFESKLSLGYNMQFCLFVAEDREFYDDICYYVQDITSDTRGIDFYEDAEKYGVITKTKWLNTNRYMADLGFITLEDITSENVNKTQYYFWAFVMYPDAPLNPVVMAKTPIYTYKSYNELIESLENPNMLSSSIYESYAKQAQKILGIYHENDSTISFNYLKMNDFSRYSCESVKELYNVPSYMLQSDEKVLEIVKNTKGFESLTDFNAVCTEYYFDSELGSFYQREKIIRQALDFEYVYDSARNSGTINVVYSDYLYKDVALRVINNDPENQLSLDVYSSDVKDNGDGTLTLTFNYEKVCTGIYNLCGWQAGHNENGVFTPGFLKSDFSVINPNDVVIDITDTELTLTFDKSNQNALFGVALDAVIYLCEDVDLTFTYEYLELGANLNATVRTSAPVIKKYSELLAMSDVMFYEQYGAVIDSAISPSVLKGQTYMAYAGIKKVYDKTNMAYNFVIQYNYNSVIRFRNDINENMVYKVLNKNSLDYVISDFVPSDYVPYGWRIARIYSSDSDISIAWNEYSPLDTTFHVNFNVGAGKIVEIMACLTDKWVLNVEYFEQYKNTPFLEKTILETEVRVLDYGNLYEISAEQLLTIMGKESFSLLDLATLEDFNVARSGDEYNVKIDYTCASLKKIDYNGGFDEVQVEITPYSEWTEMFAKTWTILFLNQPGNMFFEYENDVARENLYGFFSVAVFEERVSDLQRIFSEYSGGGCKTVFESEEVSGSALYEFFGNANGSISAKAGMFLCELFNDENKIYHSYFFYLDGTSKLNYLATNGADSYDDTDKASKNKFDDFIGGIDSYLVLILSIVLGIAGIVGTLILCSKIAKSEMHVVIKILFFIFFGALWVCIGIFGVPWIIDVINSLGGL